jgi:hypothetical protein
MVFILIAKIQFLPSFFTKPDIPDHNHEHQTERRTPKMPC